MLAQEGEEKYKALVFAHVTLSRVDSTISEGSYSLDFSLKKVEDLEASLTESQEGWKKADTNFMQSASRTFLCPRSK